MTDSTDNTNELDSYGVWVKRPSKAAPDSANVTDSTEKAADDFNMDADLPDFSEIDISSVASDLSADTADKLQDDTTLSAEELSDITGSIDMADILQPGQDSESSDTPVQEPEKVTEVSLDDFLDEGFSDSSAPAAEPAEGTDSAQTGDSEDISLDDFLDTDFSSSEEPANQDKAPDEAPLDIDLSFGSEEPAAEKVSDSFEAPEQSVSETAETAEQTPLADETGAFDDMFTSLSDAPVETETVDTAENSTGSSSLSDSDTESIDLSDFGIDAEAEETPVTTNIAETKIKNTAVDYTLSVTEDDNIEAAPVVNEIKQGAPAGIVPDSFDEEATSLIGTPSEKRETASESTEVSNELLRQIVADLSGLKNEISNLKNDFAELKAHEELVASGTPAKQSEGGFFATEDEDETISLSGDELDNIMNTAAFSNTGKESPASAEETAGNENEQTDSTADERISQYEEVPGMSEEMAEFSEDEAHDSAVSEPAVELSDDVLFGTMDTSSEVPETPAVDDTASSGLTMNFDAEHLEEPDLDTISEENSEAAVSEELPEEISIPKVDDILVESSSSDFMDSVKDSTAEIEQPSPVEVSEEPAASDGFEPEEPVISDEAVDLSAALPEESEPDTETAPVREISETTETAPDDIYPPEPSVSESLTQDNIAYLNTDENAQKELETEETAGSEEKKQSLPGDLTQEVKSVLLYMDQLLENLPEDKIIEFARSEHFATYKKLFSDLGLS